jgi:hypothetical protein
VAVGVEVGGGGELGVGLFVGLRAGVVAGGKVRVAVGVGVCWDSIGQTQTLRIWVHRNRPKTRRFIAEAILLKIVGGMILPLFALLDNLHESLSNLTKWAK